MISKKYLRIVAQKSATNPYAKWIIVQSCANLPHEGLSSPTKAIRPITALRLIPMRFSGEEGITMNREEAKIFASKWLPAWTGNNPETLAEFYSDDCFYLDPAIPSGVNGKKELLAYFRKLLAQNPEWVWTQIEPIPMEGGFLNKWLAKIPVGQNVIECVGVCFVQFDSRGKIKRNEVYFDRSGLISEIDKFLKSK